VKQSLRALRPLLWLSLFALTSACSFFANEFMTFDGMAPALQASVPAPPGE
jgi:hypothetical protein